jgi:hypothetical protein
MGSLSSSPQQAAHAARRLAAAFGEDAVVLLPEAVLVEAAPHGVLLDVQHELRVALLELDHVRLDDRRDRVPAGAHAPAVDLVARVDERDVADHRAGLLREDVQLLAQRAEGDLKVLEDAI